MPGAFQSSAFEADFQYTAGGDSHDYGPDNIRRRREWAETQVIRESDLRAKQGKKKKGRPPVIREPEPELEPVDTGPSPEQLAEENGLVEAYLVDQEQVTAQLIAAAGKLLEKLN